MGSIQWMHSYHAHFISGHGAKWTRRKILESAVKDHREHLTKKKNQPNQGNSARTKALLQAHLVGPPIVTDEGLPKKQNAADFPLVKWKFLLYFAVYCIL